MTNKEMVEALLKSLEILAGWPIILLVMFFLLRKQISSLLTDLGHRLKKAEIAGSKFEFSEMQMVAVNALSEVVDKGLEEYKNEPEQLATYVREQVKKLPEFQATTTISTTTLPNLMGRSILWVDDNPIYNAYESSVLERLGANILFARSTDEALAFLN